MAMISAKPDQRFEWRLDVTDDVLRLGIHYTYNTKH